MMPASSPSSTASEMSSSTTRWPKRICRPWASNSAIASPAQQREETGARGGARAERAGAEILPQPGKALGPEQHDEHEQQAEPQHPARGERADHVARKEEGGRAHDRAPEAYEAAAHQRHHDD